MACRSMAVKSSSILPARVKNPEVPGDMATLASAQVAAPTLVMEPVAMVVDATERSE